MKKIISRSLVLIITFLSVQSLFGQISIPYGDDAILIEGSEFVLDGRDWDYRYVSYFFINGTADIAGTEEHNAVRRAFDSWSAVTNLDFIEACNEEDADIRIVWAEGDHGDPCIHPENCFFDGEGGPLAHGFFPPPNAGEFAGDVHFDDAEDWSLTDDIDMETVALHELGHSLGLRESDVNNSVMEAFYEGERRNLTQDDIDGIRAIYGISTYPLQGPSTICTNGTFTLDEFDCLNPNFTVTWEVPNGLNITSGQGTGQINVDATSQSSSGVVRVTIDSGCDQLQFSIDVCIGTPGLPEINPDGLPTIQMCLSEALSVSITDINCGQQNSIEWWSTGSLTEMFDCTGLNCVFETTSYGSGNFYVRTGNQCGYSPTMSGAVNVGNDCNGPQFHVSPNPTTGVVEIKMPAKYYERGQPKVIIIKDAILNTILKETTTGNQKQININNQKSGIYYISIIYKDLISTQRFLKL